MTTATGSPTWRTRSIASTGCGGSFIGEPSFELISHPQGRPPMPSAAMSAPVKMATTPGADAAAFVSIPHANARRGGSDTKAAASAPGVVAIFTGADMAADGIGGLPCGWLINSKDGSPMKEPPHPVLAVERVRHVGDPVAVVIAESLGQARDAAETIALDYAVDQAVVD